MAKDLMNPDNLRTLNPKFQKFWSKNKVARALPCLAWAPPNLVVLKLSRAEPLQPYFWAKSSEILDLRSLGDMESLGLSPFCLKMFLKIDKYPNL